MKTRTLYINGLQKLMPNRQPKSVFIGHSFFGGNNELLENYRVYLRDGIIGSSYFPIFPDEIARPGHLLNSISQHILNAEISVFDVTGYNANVMIEVGLAIGMNCPLMIIADAAEDPLPDFLQELSPIFYTSPVKLVQTIRTQLPMRVTDQRERFTQPLYCVACNSNCACQRDIVSINDRCIVLGADENANEELYYNILQTIQKFDLSITNGVFQGNLTTCQWQHQMQCARLALFHLQQPYHGREYAAVNLQLGIAIGRGTPWIMLLPDHADPPTDLKGLMFVSFKTPVSFRTALSNSVKGALIEKNDYQGSLDPLPAPESESIDSEENSLIADETASEETIYTYTPKGDRIDLPLGATPIDFAYHIHTDVGHRCRGARVNGELVNLTYTLKAGDNVEIITAKRGGPSLDWLNTNLGYVLTTRARTKIRDWFRQQDREQGLTMGREVLERELKRLDLLNEFPLNTVVEAFSYPNLDDFLLAVGTGEITSDQLVNRILEIARTEASLLEPATETPNSLEVMGTGNLIVNLAKCCKPVPGDQIIGYITRGRGVTVHKTDCANVQNIKDTERLIEVSWSSQLSTQRYSVPIEIVAYDREGLMRDISTVLADERIIISTVNVSTRQNIATFQCTLEIESVQQLGKLLHQLEVIPSVIEAKRKT